MPATDTPEDALPPGVAAIVDDGRCDVDALLAEVVQACRAEGRRVRGLLMHRTGGDALCGDMVLVDIDTAEPYLASQPLGSASQGCRADPQGFARASVVLRRALDEAPELVVCNRFGGLEAEGQGFRAELLELLSRGLPLLTAVGTRHLPAWQRFTGGTQLLPAEREAVQAWLRQTLAPAG